MQYIISVVKELSKRTLGSVGTRRKKSVVTLRALMVTLPVVSVMLSAATPAAANGVRDVENLTVSTSFARMDTRPPSPRERYIMDLREQFAFESDLNYVRGLAAGPGSSEGGNRDLWHSDDRWGTS
jgi:hypothetical protein